MVSTLIETKLMQVVDVQLATLNHLGKLNANHIDSNYAMSIAQADAVLGHYGYVNADAIAA